MPGLIAWVGGKNRLAPEIIKRMPPHESYIEVFGGGAWVLFNKGRVKTEVYNDLNGDLVNLFRVVRDHGALFENRQYFLLSSREEYKAFRAAWRADRPKDRIDRAIMLYYLLKNAFGANIESGWATGRTGKPRYCSGLENISVCRERLKNVFIENRPFDKCIELWDHEGALFYLDPPYLGTEFYYKKSAGRFSLEGHERLRDACRAIKGRFILSYEDNPEIRRLYKGFTVELIGELKRCLNNRIKDPKTAREILIMNY